MLQDLIHPGAVVKRGDKQQAVKSFKEALDWLLARGAQQRRDPALQGTRRNESRAAVGDDDGSGGAAAAQGADRGRHRSEEIFSTLMGEQVEPRRAFIETNALGVRNLDV